MAKQNTLVLFDVGGVLLELNYEKFYKEGARITKTSHEQFKDDYIHSQLELNSLRGDISNEDYQRQLKQFLGDPDMSGNELEEIVRNCWGNEIREVVDLKQEVYFKAECLVGIFSNAGQFSFEYLSKTYPRLFQTFNPEAPVICSYISKSVKPESRMYKNAEQRAKSLNCNNIILIEDKRKYLLTGIKDFGWKGIWFTPYIDLTEAIRQTDGPDDIQLSSGEFRQADSLRELKQALNEFGVPLN